jgi:sugar transferase EpsL
VTRLIDVVVAAVALVALSPLLAGIALLLLVSQGRPILFGQLRAGRHGRPFTLWKFRTMTDERDRRGGHLPDDRRLTPLGRRLRSTSLDELPELFNILVGDMSLVGPRPLPVRYLTRYTTEELRRHDVRPGLTGWAQVHGRNAVSWDERLALDVWYVDHRSLLLDLRILARTVGIVLRREGISGEGTATMAELRPPEGDWAPTDPG